MTARALVIGAGPAGLAAARKLAQWCASVVVVESRTRGDLRHAGEHLPPAALSELAELGLEAVFSDERHEHSPGVRSAWGDSHFTDKEYFLSAPGRGLNIDRGVFDGALMQQAEGLGVALRFATRLQRLVAHADEFEATLRAPNGLQTIVADCVVDATGRSAAAARHLGARRRRRDPLIGLVGQIERCKPIEETGRVHVESTEHGWWYGVQFANGTLLAALMTDPAIVRRHPDGASGLWRECLRDSELLWPIASSGQCSGRVDLFDAATQDIEFEGPPGFLAVGDAATAYDPLSSWGITKGILDGDAGAAALASQLHGDAHAVEQHRSRQRRDFDAHLSKQQVLYEAEHRWPASPFWRARQRQRQTADLINGSEQ